MEDLSSTDKREKGHERHRGQGSGRVEFGWVDTKGGNWGLRDMRERENVKWWFEMGDGDRVGLVPGEGLGGCWPCVQAGTWLR